MASSDSSTDSRDNIPLSQIASPAAAARSKLSSTALRDVINPPRDDKSDSTSDDEEVECSDDDAYRPRPSQLSRNREVLDSSDESSSSSDEEKKPRAKRKKKNSGKKKPSQSKNVKCQGKACPGLPPSEHTPMIKCAWEECSKNVHRVCYEKQLSKSSVARAPIGEYVFCNLGHHDKFVKAHSEQELTWTNDGKDGPDDPKTSQYFLVEWLSSEENYQRYRDPPGALTKSKVCEEIAIMLSTKGTKNKWKGENVYNKIQHIEQKMKSCHDGFAGTKTGHGLKETDPMGYDDKVSPVVSGDVLSTTHFLFIHCVSRFGVFVHTTSTWRMYSALVRA
jgi:hypothetical protein